MKKHKKAKEKGLIPPTAIPGSDIGIHGVPIGRNDIIDQQKNWTLGCISLKTEHINEVYAHIGKNSMITIQP